MIDKQIITIDGKEFGLHKFPATVGREVLAKYPFSGLPKIGDYAINEEMMYKVLSYVSVDVAGTELMLSTRALVDNHTVNAEILLKVEWAMMEYNFSFLQHGGISNFLEDLAQMLPEWILEMLTRFSDRLSQKEKQPLTN